MSVIALIHLPSLPMMVIIAVFIALLIGRIAR
jgi:hypothetical protein